MIGADNQNVILFYKQFRSGEDGVFSNRMASSSVFEGI